MRQTFPGHTQAIDFAQIESRKLNKKMFVFLTRDDGVKYVACDTVGKLTVKGKLLNEYGYDLPPTPVIHFSKPIIKETPPPPIEPEPIEEQPAPVVEEEKEEETIAGTAVIPDAIPEEKPKKKRIPVKKEEKPKDE